MTNYLETLDVIERHLSEMLADLRKVAVPGAEAVLEAAWSETTRLTGQTYSWPPENGGVEAYDPFVIYQANGLTLALAENVAPTWVKERDRKQIWVFQCEADGSHKRPISPFIGTDDYDDTREMIAIIRGSGESGRAMFAPGTLLPPPYDRLRTEILGNRVSGHYNKLAVVADENDVQAMLLHGAGQIRMRGW